MKYLKEYNEYNFTELEEKYSKFKDLIIDTGDDNKEDELEKLEIINKYFPFSNVSGVINYQTGIVDLNFNNGEFTIKGQYNNESETQPSIFTINDESFDFNFHEFQMSGANTIEFEKEIKWIKDSIGKWSLCLRHEAYSVMNIGVYNSEEEAIKAAEEYKMVLVKGILPEGKKIGRNFKDL